MTRSRKALRERPHARCSRAPGSPTRISRSRSSESRTRGPRSRRATSTCVRSPSDVKAGVRAAGGTPIEFNTIAVSDGITMGTEGMRGSLVSREVIADSIELFVLVAHARRRRRAVGLRQDDPGDGDGARAARRARARALRRTDRAGPLRGQATSRSRTCSRRSARTRPARCRRSELRELEDKRVSRRGRVRRAVHREHDGDRDRRCSASRRWARTRCRRWIRAKHDVARECGALVMQLIARGRAAARAAHAHGVRERDRVGRGDRAARRTPCCTCSRSRARPACRSRSTTSTRSPRARRCSPTSSRAAASPRST